MYTVDISEWLSTCEVYTTATRLSHLTLLASSQAAGSAHQRDIASEDQSDDSQIHFLLDTKVVHNNNNSNNVPPKLSVHTTSPDWDVVHVHYTRFQNLMTTWNAYYQHVNYELTCMYALTAGHDFCHSQYVYAC